jgi:hypothetical protein
MNTTTYDEVTNTASIGPGSTWEAVYKTLKDEWNVTTVGGRASVVGVGGFVTGGGVRILAAGICLSCAPRVLNAKLLTTDGRDSTPSTPMLSASHVTR